MLGDVTAYPSRARAHTNTHIHKYIYSTRALDYFGVATLYLYQGSSSSVEVDATSPTDIPPSIDLEMNLLDCMML